MSRSWLAPGASVDRLHRTLDIPQADRLETVRALVAAVRDGISPGPNMLELLDVDRRHFLYYRQAAVILGVIEFTPRGIPRVTPLGQRILAAAEGSSEERRGFAEAIQSARALRPFASFFTGETVEPEVLADRLVALTGLSQSTAARRAHTLIRWRAYVFGPNAANTPGLVLPDISSKLKKLVDHHNAVVKQQTLQWLMHGDPTRLEKIVAELLAAMGYSDVDHRGGAFDGGVDVVARRAEPLGRFSTVAAQVKRYSAAVGRACIDELLGVLHRDRFDRGIVFTTSTFTAQAREVALDSKVQLIDGVALVNSLAAHGVILKAGPHGELQLA